MRVGNSKNAHEGKFTPGDVDYAEQVEPASQAGLTTYALRLLGRRMMTAAELRARLLLRADPERVEAVLDKLTGWNYLDDAAFARAYVRNRAGRYGELRLRHELLHKGVMPALIEEALAERPGNTHQQALRLLRKYAWRHKGDKAKAVRFLLSRGFPLDLALLAFDDLHDEDAEE